MDLLLTYLPEILTGIFFVLSTFWGTKLARVQKFIEVVVEKAKDRKVTAEEVQEIIIAWDAIKTLPKKE